MMPPTATSYDLAWFASLATVVGLGVTLLAFAFLGWRYNTLKKEELRQSRRLYADALIARASGAEGLRMNPETQNYETSEFVVLSAIVGLRDFPEYLPVMDMMLRYYSKDEALAGYRASMAESITLAEGKLSGSALKRRKKKLH